MFIESKVPLHDAEDQEELCGVSQVDQLMASGDYGSAKQVMYSLMERQAVPVFGDSLKYAQILYRLGESHEAEEWFKIALKLQPDAPDCYEALGQMCAQQHRNEEALMHLEKAGTTTWSASCSSRSSSARPLFSDTEPAIRCGL